ELSLPSLDLEEAHTGREACPAVLGYSPAVAPPPDDWPAHRHVTGYWTGHDDAHCDDETLRAFVSDGEPPLYVGFGSMPHDPRIVAGMLHSVTRRAGGRSVYATGWADATRLPALPDTVFVTPHVSHRWLFPRALAAVHH